MRQAVLILIAVFAVTSAAVTPDEGRIAASAMIGTSGILGAKYWLSKRDAVELGVEYIDHPWAVFYADYSWNIPGLFGGKGAKFWRELSLYIKGGGGAGFWDRKDECGRWNCKWNPESTGSGNGFFLRLLVGLEWYPKRSPFTVFGEVGPSYMWYPTNGNTIDVNIGGRYYF
jgi:hypothetical protein